MGDVQVKRATMAGSRIDRVVVKMDRLPERTVDRDTLVRWMRDGHSAIPVVGGKRLPALLLVEVTDAGGGDTYVVRDDPAPVDEDRLPPLPTV